MTRLRDGKGHRAYRRKQGALKRQTAIKGLVCSWCGQPIDTTLPRTDPMSFSADHPQALENGGHIVHQDLESFHLRCNSLKGDSAETEIWPAT